MAATSVPDDHDGVVGPLLMHGETFSYVFEDEWVYDYICTPHPYMKGRVIVKEPEYRLPTGDAAGLTGGSAVLAGWVLPLLILCLVLATLSFVRSGKH